MAESANGSKNKKDLVIVESPAKAKTINKYLGPDYVVRASMGHVRDLPRKGMGVNLETFQPDYEIIDGRGKVVTELKKLAKDAETVWLATDLDREGEAIAWHIKEALKLKDDRVRRVVFNAITKDEIDKAFARPGAIDIDRVNAQQARRILDRVVGFEISPVLWRKVARGLSAGRVQSVSVRLVVDREREIEAFTPDEYWRIGGIFSPEDQPALREAWRTFLTSGEDGSAPPKKAQQGWLGENGAFSADLVEWAGSKFEPTDAEAAAQVAGHLGLAVDEIKVEEDPEGKGPAKYHKSILGRLGGTPTFSIDKIEKKRTRSRPPGPFITSTLQQAASSRLGFGAARTMRVAQTLYEGGHITYMRTDSTNLSADAVKTARTFIDRHFGERYLPEKPNVYASRNKNAQEAHEAIRPTDVVATPERLGGSLGPDEARLYKLIYERFLACQMMPAEFDQTAISIVADTPGGRAVFRATGRKLVFDGFMRVSGVSSEDQLLPDVGEGASVFAVDVQPSQHFTSPPPRFTEASLVKELESLGIGRPSTYASIIDTIQKREYVIQQNRAFYATLLGKVVTDKLMQAFPEIMDVGFTADMENRLDDIEGQHTDWIKLLKDFYGPFHEGIGEALEKLDHAGGMASPYVDEETGAKLVYRIGKNGFFLAAEDRELKVTKPVDAFGKPTLREESEFDCPKSGHPMIKRKGRFGSFLGCSGYPECQLIVPLDKNDEPLPPKIDPVETTVPCEKCGSTMLLRDSKRGPFLGCGSFPKCRSTKMVRKLPKDQLDYVNTLLPDLRKRVEESHHLVAKMTGKPADGFGPLPTDHIEPEPDKPKAAKKAKKSSKKAAKKVAAKS
jgi:DNA topoisomerase-1